MLVNAISLESFPKSTLNLKYEAIDFGSSAKNERANIELFKMYAMDTLCEHDIFRIVSPIDFKFDL